jgi:Cytochrome oxidase complex assembly protein 1
MEILTVLLTTLIGVGFLLLGRWLYLNPGKMFPAWGLFNREHPGVQKLGRVYGVFFIFFGIFASVAVSFSFLLRSVPGLTLLAFPIAVAGAWFLRPKMPQSEPPVAAASQGPQKQPLLSKHWKRYLAIAGCFAGILIVVVSLTLGDSEVAKMAVAAAESNPVVKQRLGDPIKRGFFTSGSIEIDGPSGHADLEIPISGSRGKAKVYAVAMKSAGVWKFETLDVAFDEASPRVSLLQAGSNTSNP